MTSKITEECFVYIMLPSDSRFVTAGRFLELLCIRGFVQI